MTSATPLHRYAQITVAFAALVLFAGAMVTSTGSGMAVPDWPQSFGTWTPRMTGGVFYEHGHRMVAGTLGLLVLGLSAWAAVSERRSWARWLTWGALIAVLGQAALGGLTVLRGTFNDWNHTDPIFSTLHASLAQALFGILVAYAAVSAPGWQMAPTEGAPRRLASWAKALAALVYVQIVVGAVMRHQHAGLAIPDFPANYGQVIPTFYNWLVALNFAHRCGAWILATAGMGLAWRVAKDPSLDPWLRQPAWVLLGAIMAQFLLGACVVWTQLGLPILTSLHVLGGAVVFTSALVLALRLGRASQGA
ncbi:MAG TPA: COX15/CtaA family protein [bacterium]|nr:COX15/CtaA family protein [bacterium]